MNIFDIERMAKEEKEYFGNLVNDIYINHGIVQALKMIKKSGICINEFGTGEIKDPNLYNNIISDLRNRDGDSQIIDRFDKEVKLINKLYKELSNKLKINIESKIPEDLHIASYVVAVEMFLNNCNYEPFLNMINIKSTNLKNKTVNVYENVIDSISIVLKYFIYKKYPFNNINTKIINEYIMNATEHINLASIRKALKVIEELWSYFDINISNIEGVPEFKAIDEHAFAKNISTQMFFDIRNAKMSRYAYEKLYINKSYKISNKLPPYSYICGDEEMSCEFIYEYFAIDDLSVKFNGVTLAEMIRAYSVISHEAEVFIRKRKKYLKNVSLNDMCIVRTKHKWIKVFNEFGIEKDIAEKIVELLTFNNKSIDLYDCPFIKFDNFYVIIPSAVVLTDSARAIISNLNSKNINISVKGNKFEEQIRNVINSAGIKCDNIYENKNDEKFECDAAFIIDNDLFFVEAKHLNHPLNYRDYQRNLDELEEACEQLTRICNHFVNDSDIIRNKFRIESINNVYKIIVTNTAHGKKLSFNGCIVTDETSFFGYFKRRPSVVNEIKGNQIIIKKLFENFYEGDINSKQFVSFLHESPHIELYSKRISYEVFDFSKESGFVLIDYCSKIDTFVPIDQLNTEEYRQIKKVYNWM